MLQAAQRRTILMADDDNEDCLLVRDALREIGRPYDLRFVHDGEELLDYLCRRGQYESGRNAPCPDLILLDLKMPRKGGCDALRDIKSDPHHRRIPVVALTTSSADDDINTLYHGGVNSYVTKPATFRDLVALLDTIVKYWFEVAQLPPKAHHGGKTH
jgi:CheY-like chemotaxis protein